jgi:hypothetical protein
MFYFKWVSFPARGTTLRNLTITQGDDFCQTAANEAVDPAHDLVTFQRPVSPFPVALTGTSSSLKTIECPPAGLDFKGPNRIHNSQAPQIVTNTTHFK